MAEHLATAASDESDEDNISRAPSWDSNLYEPSEGEGNPGAGDEISDGNPAAGNPAAGDDGLSIQSVMPGICDAMVVKGIVADKPLGPIHGSRLHNVVAATLSSHNQAEAGSRYDKLVDKLIMQSRFSTNTSFETLADETDLNRRNLSRDIVLVASALVESDRYHRVQLEQEVVATFPPRKRLMLLDSCAYDETPMPVVVTEVEQDALDDLAESLPTVPTEGSQVLAVPLLPIQRGDTSKKPVKLMQSSQEYAMLLQLSDPPQPGPASDMQEQDQKYLVIIGDTIDWLQRIESTSTRATLAAQEKISALTEASLSFRLHMRSACNDDAKSNPATERLIVQRRASTGIKWLGWRWFCEVHKVSTAFEWVFSILEWVVSGMINVSLSVNFGSSLATFRLKVKEVIMNLIRWRTTPIDRAAQEFKMHILRIFLSSGKEPAYKCMVLMHLLPGDWRDRDHIDLIRQNCETEQQQKERVATGVSDVLAGSQIHTWPRHRWIGADQASSDIGLLSAIHGLIYHAYPLFVGSSSRSSAAAYAEAVEPMQGAMDSGDATGAAAAAADAAQYSLVPYDDGGETAGLDADAAACNKSAEANSRARKRGLAFVEQNASDEVVTVRLTMEPLRCLMESKLWVGSERWELHQQGLAASRSLEGAGGWPHRSFPLLEAARNKQEQVFFQRLAELSGEALWKSIQNTTEGAAALAFKLQSRAGCMIEQLLAAPHRLSPFDLFLVLIHPEKGPALAELAECLQHPLVESFVQEYGASLGNMESRMKIFLLLLKSKTNICKLESLHAWIRRILHMRIQTHGLTLREASAMWCCKRQRARLPRTPKTCKKRPAAATDMDMAKPKQKLTPKPKQNGWHLWCRQA